MVVVEVLDTRRGMASLGIFLEKWFISDIPEKNMDDLNSAMQSIKMGMSLLSDAIGLTNKAKELLPNSKDKDAIEKSLKEAAGATRLAEAQIANALGYSLCKCTFPPQIMLSKGYKETGHGHAEEFICPKCDKSSIPPPDKPVTTPTSRGFF